MAPLQMASVARLSPAAYLLQVLREPGSRVSGRFQLWFPTGKVGRLPCGRRSSWESPLPPRPNPVRVRRPVLVWSAPERISGSDRRGRGAHPGPSGCLPSPRLHLPGDQGLSRAARNLLPGRRGCRAAAGGTRSMAGHPKGWGVHTGRCGGHLSLPILSTCAQTHTNICTKKNTNTCRASLLLSLSPAAQPLCAPVFTISLWPVFSASPCAAIGPGS